MTEKVKSLKEEYSWKLWTFIILNFVIFYVTFIGKYINFLEINQFWRHFVTKESLIAFIAPVITIILNGILPTRAKETLVFWKLKNPLPGSKVFSELAKKDSRIDLRKLIQMYGEIPKSAKEQNQLWYKIYKSHESKVAVLSSHRNFLFTRDLTGISAVFLIVLPLVSLIAFGNSIQILFYSLYVILQYLVLSIVARNYGNRFVCNVLAEDSI